MKNKQKAANFFQTIGLVFIFLFFIAYLGSMHTRQIAGLAIAEALAFIGVAFMLYGKRLRDGYIFCSK